jgi:hypothetical protein
MKKKLTMKKKTLKSLKLKLKQINDRKVAPAVLLAPSNGSSCYA